MSVRVVIAFGGPESSRVATELSRAGIEVECAVDPGSPAAAAAGDAIGGQSAAILRALGRADALALRVDRHTLTADLVATCDRSGTRILPLCDDADAERWAAAFGLSPALLAGESWAILDALRSPSPETRTGADSAGPAGRVIAVWGPSGAPGRTTVAALLAFELARGGRHAALVDADAHAPSLALGLGLADEGPGFAAACRQAGLGRLDARELTRISAPLTHEGGVVDVLCGLNRPARWPELTEERVDSALRACREWADVTIVDVAATLERDEEIMSDLEGPRRNAATLAALRSADAVVAVVAADPVGVARFLRGYAELRALVGATPIVVAANKLRPGALGIDARGQVRRTLQRFAGIDDVWFLPLDPRSADAAVLQARPVAQIAPRSPLVAAARRLAGEGVLASLGGVEGLGGASAEEDPTADPHRRRRVLGRHRRERATA